MGVARPQLLRINVFLAWEHAVLQTEAALTIFLIKRHEIWCVPNGKHTLPANGCPLRLLFLERKNISLLKHNHAIDVLRLYLQWTTPRRARVQSAGLTVFIKATCGIVVTAASALLEKGNEKRMWPVRSEGFMQDRHNLCSSKNNPRSKHTAAQLNSQLNLMNICWIGLF